MENKYKCITCAVLNDGTGGYAVKLRSDGGEVLDGTSSKELTPDEYYAKGDIKIIQRTQTPRPKSVDSEKASTKSDEPAKNKNVDDISTESVTNAPVKKSAAKKAAAKKSS